jgi:SAM-dependent methyltransferase
MEPSAENVSAPLNRIRLYREFLGKEHECVQISRFLAALCESYGLSAKAPLRVLDAGCGVGRMFDEMVITHKWETTGIEPDRDYFEESCKVADEIRSRNPEAQLRVIHAGFTGMNEHNRYDFVAAINGPFYYLLRPQDRLHALQSIYSSLAPGGIILLDMANFQYLLHQLGPVGGTHSAPPQPNFSI